ncbi:flagellar export protein FliJ [Caldicoprobacter guelmensis]|uniref:flagellar export protein FliJ n=1 Tax=Caldicoprobacter guelmensis TaxID=1170224 RepID=UPI0019587C74|nr:flagellar export protein FliJ [Caldicoprobacter guelmensis]MBM7581380.1 flagellar export protein FliJ [Caldicoprobacter guelmensis]
MAKFKFSLEVLLKVKELKKRQAETEYAEVQRKLDRQLAMLSKLTDEYHGVVSEMDRIAANGTTVYHMKRYSDYSLALRRQVELQQQVVDKVTNDVDAAKSRLIGLIREVNVLNEVKERQYYQYRLEEEKRYQNAIDEYASYKIYKQGGLINGRT